MAAIVRNRQLPMHLRRMMHEVHVLAFSTH